MTKGVTLVLSGGGARGIAHVGVIKELEQAGIPIRRIVGSSAGALIGALYASCLDAKKLESFITKIPVYKLPDVSFSGQGIVDGARLSKLIKDFTGAERFSDLKIPLVVNATDLHTGEEIVFKKGKLLPALQASSAFPGMIKPVSHEGRLLIDGGVSHTLPVHLASSRLPLVLSDVTGGGSLNKKPSLFFVMRQSLHLLIKNAVDKDLQRTKKRFVRVRPDVSAWEIFSLRDAEKLVLKGEEAMHKALPRLKRLLK